MAFGNEFSEQFSINMKKFFDISHQEDLLWADLVEEVFKTLQNLLKTSDELQGYRELSNGKNKVAVIELSLSSHKAAYITLYRSSYNKDLPIAEQFSIALNVF